jgi:hypothetical protein
VCRIPRVLVVAPAGRHGDLRRRLSSLEYDVVTTEDAADPVAADAVLVFDEADERRATAKGVPVLRLAEDELGSFAPRLWQALRAR